MLEHPDGIYPEMDEPTYRAIKNRANYSFLKMLGSKTPAHAKYAADNPPEPTPALLAGSYFHDLMESPDKVRSTWAVMPNFDGRTKAGKEGKAEFGELNKGKRIIPHNLHQSITQMYESAMTNKLVRAVMEDNNCLREAPFLWTDSVTSTPCKALADVLNPDGGYILDWKSTIDAAPAVFPRQFLNVGYDLQAAGYLEGARTLGLDIKDFLVVAIEKSPPYGVCVYRVPDSLIEIGLRRWREACRIWNECTESDIWPGYPENIIELAAPSWAIRELYETETTEE